MPRSRQCDYCGGDIEPGTGTMFVRVNGQTVHFCSSKCEKNADLGREARDLEWTAAGRGPDREEAETVAQPDTETSDEPVEADDEGESEEADEPVEADDEGESEEADEPVETDDDSEAAESEGDEETEEAQA